MHSLLHSGPFIVEFSLIGASYLNINLSILLVYVVSEQCSVFASQLPIEPKLVRSLHSYAEP